MRKNRPYKKGSPFRDARLFVVACEGENREKEYFECWGKGTQRLKIKVLPAESGSSLSAPKWVVDRLTHFIEKEKINIKHEDQIWLVMDVDRWKPEQLYEIANLCKAEQWGFALSNPCFEVWLFYHIQDDANMHPGTCQEYKKELNKAVKGGYHPDKFLPLAPEAILRCKKLDKNPDSPIPPNQLSRVYLVMEEMLRFL